MTGAMPSGGRSGSAAGYVLAPPVLPTSTSSSRNPNPITAGAQASTPSTPVLRTPSTPMPTFSSSSTTTPTFPSDSIYHTPSPIPPAAPRPERKSIRIWCTSWNMGDALPKGHLEELFGPVPTYQPPAEAITEFPSLLPGTLSTPLLAVSTPTSPPSPARTSGPTVAPPPPPTISTPPASYHILIVSTQETPTPSGVPRGLAAGVTKGLGVGGQKEKEKIKEKEWRKEVGRVREEMRGAVKDVLEAVGIGAGVEGEEGGGVGGEASPEGGLGYGTGASSIKAGAGAPRTPSHKTHEADSYLFPPSAPATSPNPTRSTETSLAPGAVSSIGMLSAAAHSTTIQPHPSISSSASAHASPVSHPFPTHPHEPSTRAREMDPALTDPDSTPHHEHLIRHHHHHHLLHPASLQHHAHLDGSSANANAPHVGGPNVDGSIPAPGSVSSTMALGMATSVGTGAIAPGPGIGGVGGGGGGALGNRGWSDMLEDYFCHGIDEPLNSQRQQAQPSLSAKPSLSRRNSRARAASNGSHHSLSHSHSHSTLHLHHPLPATPSHLTVPSAAAAPPQKTGPDHALGLGFLSSEDCRSATPGISPSGSVGLANSFSMERHGPGFAANLTSARPVFNLQDPPAGQREFPKIWTNDVSEDSTGRALDMGSPSYRERMSDMGVDVYKELPAVPNDDLDGPMIPGPPGPRTATGNADRDHLTAPSPHSLGPQITRGPSPLRKDLAPLTIPATVSSEIPPDLTRNKSGPYHFLVKERLLGLYVAVFIHKDCLDWVEGYDHDYVPAGLVGGRVGNKGGIGISLKMAGHSFLFVNSHLAAHTSKLDARLANVRKIKADLQLDDFLPESHPRARAPDITDRFDTCIWMGDLNFRLEVSRLHADWLVSRKEYAQALEFDQLRKVQKNGTGFADFTEAPIDFPPTYKFDVMHSAKRMRSIQKKKDAKARAKEQGAIHEEVEEEEEPLDIDEESEGASMSDRRGSLDSQKWLSSSLGIARPGAPPIDEDDEEDDPITVQQPQRPISAVARTSALKAKSRFLKFVKGSSMGSSNSSSPSQTPKSTSPPQVRAPIAIDHALTPPNPAFASPNVISPAGSPTPSETGDQQQSVSPSGSRPGLSRNLSTKLRRKMSGRHRGGDTSSDSSSDEEEDTRIGVYDTSSKQRVPSWCDRVLWKSASYPVDYPFELPPRPHNQGHPMHRLSLLFSQRSQRRNGDRKLSTSGSVNDLASPAVARGAAPAHNARNGPLSPVNDRQEDVNGDLNRTDVHVSAKVSNARSSSISSANTPNSSDHLFHSGLRSARSGAPLRPDQSDFTGSSRANPTRRTSGEPSVAGAKRWLHSLPTLLSHGHHSPRENTTPNLEVASSDPMLPDRRKGDVECIRYGTIDDAGMRRLEGRSDHRPILFAAAVYV